jgi:arylsulfatase A-like enzyme
MGPNVLMKKLRLPKTVVFLSALIAAMPCFAQDAGNTRPNVILCMTDDQGWADVSYNESGRLAKGKFKTVELDKMAESGLRFDRFYAAAAFCSPTRGSCLTGRNPYRYGVTSPGRPLKLEEKTIAHALGAAGYRTGHFGKWHLNGKSGPGKPVAKDDPLSPGAFGFQHWFSVSNFFESNWTFSRNGEPVATEGDGSDVIVAEALRWLDEGKDSSQKPFFAVIWFGNPHTPHKPLAADLQAAGGDPELAEIAGVDRAMGTLRKALRDRGLADNTMLWFCSDNGRPGPNNPLRGKKGGVYEGGIRVPGICEWPARVKPERTSVPAVTSDFYPTILSAAGISVPKDKPQPIDGINLLPLLEGKMTERPAPIGFMEGKTMAWSDNRYKIIAGKDGSELYDLTGDFGETKNIAGENPAIVKRMGKDLDAWIASVNRSKAGADYRK